MLFDVTHIDAPPLVPMSCAVRHLLALPWCAALGLSEPVELAIEGEQPPTGGLGKMDTDLLQSRTRYAPSSGLSTTSFLTSLIALNVTLRAGTLGVLGLSSSPVWPSVAQRLSTSYTRWRGVCR